MPHLCTCPPPHTETKPWRVTLYLPQAYTAIKNEEFYIDFNFFQLRKSAPKKGINKISKIMLFL